jgi:hypothetical protein
MNNNTDAQIADALRFAADTHTTERSAIEVLDSLHGVGVPIASAILTTINPARYTIIDFRALEALGVSKWPSGSVGYYLHYLRKCHELAHQYHVSLRTLDRALWQWSKEHGKQKSVCPPNRSTEQS